MLQLCACATSSQPEDSCPTTNGKNFAIKNEPRSRYGNPACYDVDGKKYYVLNSARGYCQTGLASWYGTKFHGRKTSSREPYNMFALTAASRNLPLPTYVEVTNLENGKRIIVKVNDRGPFKSDRIIDLSYAAAQKLGFANKGTANVKVKAIDTQQLQEEGIAPQTILANNQSIPEIQINPVELPTPNQAPKPVTLTRYLQLGAFANHDNALRLEEKIAILTHAPIRIKEAHQTGKTIYRVQIGPFSSPDEFTSIQHTLTSKGFEHVITVFS